MALLEVKTYGDEILKKKISAVKEFDNSLKEIQQDMIETMDFYDGIGLAANQVNLDLQMVIINENLIDDEKGYLTLINPEIKSFGNETEKYEEGCLSVPGIYAEVIRPTEIDLTYYDLEGKKHEIHADGLLARVAQHEIDHLNGVIFVERLPKMKQKMLQSKLRKI